MAATTYGIKAGKAFVLIEAVDLTAKVLNQVRNRLGKFGSEMSQIGQTMAFRSAAALTPVAFSLRTFASFDDSLRIVEARSKGTAGEMDALREQAKELGRTTAFTASHIGNLMARLAQFGKTRSEIAQMTEPIMLLARSGGTGKDLEQDILNATDAVTQMMASFKLETKDTGHVADLLTVAVNNSKFSLEELGTALGYAAPVAHNFGMTMEETLATLAGIRELGVDASIAGTALRNMFLYVSQAKEREDFNQKLKELTGSMINFTDEAGNLRNMNDILLAIGESLKDVGNLDASDLLTQLFETRATVPAMGVGKSIETLSRMRKVLSEVDGAAKKTHDRMETGMGGAFRVLESAAEGVAIAIGSALNNSILTTSGATELVIKNVSDWIYANQGMVTTAVAATVAVGALGLTMIVLGQTLRMLSGLFLLTIVPAQLLALLFSPGGLMIVGLVAFIALLPQISSGLGKLVADFGTTISELTKSWRETFTGISTYLASGEMNEAFKLLSLQIQVTWKDMLDKLMTAWEGFKSSFVVSNPILDAYIAIEESQIARRKRNNKHGWFDKEIADREARINSLKATYQGMIDEVSAPHEGRTKELADLNKQLQTLKDSAEIYRQLMTEAPTPSTSSPVPDFRLELETAMKAAKDLIVPAIEGPRVAAKPLEGAEKGSIEAAKAIQEAKFNLMEKSAAETAKHTRKAAEELEKIREGIIAIGEGALAGI